MAVVQREANDGVKYSMQYIQTVMCLFGCNDSSLIAIILDSSLFQVNFLIPS